MLFDTIFGVAISVYLLIFFSRGRVIKCFCSVIVTSFKASLPIIWKTSRPFTAFVPYDQLSCRSSILHVIPVLRDQASIVSGLYLVVLSEGPWKLSLYEVFSWSASLDLYTTVHRISTSNDHCVLPS